MGVIMNIIIGQNTYGWYVCKQKNPNEALYLHNDGKWRKSTDCGGKYTGYFPTKEEAEETYKKYPA